jgi:hypothetical protein
VLGLGPFSLFLFFSFDFEHHCIGFFAQNFWIFWIFFHAPSFIWTLLMIEKFLLCPPVLLGHFQSLRFFFLCFSHLPPSVGCDPSQGYFQKHYQAQKGTAKDIFQPCERIIKDGLSSSQMHAFRIGKPCFHASMQNDFSLFIQIKLNFGVTSWCFLCFFFFLFLFRFSRSMVTFLRNHLNFQNSFVLDKHQHDFYFCTKL